MDNVNDGKEDREKSRLQKQSHPSFAYAETVRGHQRNALDAESCACCERYYEATGQQRLKTISRHRSPFKRPPSPPGFWDIGSF